MLSSTTPQDVPILVGQSGTVSANLDWTPGIVRNGTFTGSIPATGHVTNTIKADGLSQVTVNLTWSGSASTTLSLKDSTAVTIATSSGSSSPLTLNTSVAGGTYTVQVDNTSTSIDIPSFSAAWTTTTQANTTSTGTVPAAGNATPTVTADAPGNVNTTLTWTKDNHPVTSTSTMNIPGGGSTTQSITPDATGTISAQLSWPTTTHHMVWSSTVGLAASTTHSFTASANGVISMTLTWPTGTPNPDLDLYLLDASGTTLRSSTSLSGNSESVTYDTTGTYPANATFSVKVAAKATGSSFTVDGTYPVTPTVDLKLENTSGTILANSTLSGTRQRTLTYPSAPSGTYVLRGSSSDEPTNPSTFSETHQLQAWATGTYALKDSSGTTIAGPVSGSTGTLNLTSSLPAAGTYTLAITDTSADLAMPSYTVSTNTPSLRTTQAKLELKDGSGNVVASGVTGAKPQALSYAAPIGASMRLTVTPLSGIGTGPLQATYPPRPNKEVIGYDGNDHAISIDDGTSTVLETLSATGRVLRRQVKDSITNAVSEDTTFGYYGAGDSPAYSKPTPGGTPLTTYITGPEGLLVTDTGGDPTYPLANAHGDIIGTTNGAGTFAVAPVSDEFGLQTVPSSRLGWLGEHERFFTGGTLSVFRMGVRLYDPSLGRFLEADPVGGGSATDYDYGNADPVNSVDLDGNFPHRKKKQSTGRSKRGKHEKGLGRAKRDKPGGEKGDTRRRRNKSSLSGPGYIFGNGWGGWLVIPEFTSTDSGSDGSSGTDSAPPSNRESSGDCYACYA